MVKILINRSDEEKPLMSEEQAAEMIQASFRGYKTRKNLRSSQENNHSDEEVDEKTEDIFEDVDEKSVTDLSIDSDAIEEMDLNDEELIRAATVIQNSYRNYKKQLQNNVSVDSENGEQDENDDNVEEVDINLNAAELRWAAALIQLSYKNYITKRQKGSTESETAQDENGNEEKETTDNIVNENENEIGVDLEDPELQTAAVKIQSAFRGYTVRKALYSEDTAEVEDEEKVNEE